MKVFKSDKLIFVAIGLVLACMFLRNALHIEIPVSIILFFSVIPMCIATPSQMVAMLVSFIPLSTGFQYKYALLLYLIIGVARFHRYIKPTKAVLIIIAMMVWELAHGLSGEFSISEFMRCFAELLILCFIMCIKWDNVNIKLISRSLAIATIGTCLIITYIEISGGLGSLINMISQSAAEYRFGQDTTDGATYGLNFNANQLGFICNMAIASLLVLIARKEHSILDIVMLGILVFFGLITLSRTFVAVALFLFAFFIFASPGSAKQRTRNILLFAIIAPILFLLVFEFTPSIIENFVARNDTDDITNGRAGLMTFYHEHIFSSFEHCFWGIGLQGYGGKLANMYGHQVVVCHNGIQELWVTWGIVGVVLFALMIFSMIITSKRWANNRVFFALLPLCALLFSSMAGQLISSGTYLLSLSLTYIVMCLKWNKHSIYPYAKR